MKYYCDFEADQENNKNLRKKIRDHSFDAKKYIKERESLYAQNKSSTDTFGL